MEEATDDECEEEAFLVETNARCLIEAVRQIPQPPHICLEEGTLSKWLHRGLSPHAEEVVVAAVSESRGSKDDPIYRQFLGSSITNLNR